MAEKKKILLLTANPAETTQLSLPREAREISNCLQAARHRDRFELTQETAVRIEDLRRSMFYHQPSIVQFSGHGLSDGLILEDDAGKSQIVSTGALSDFFKLFANQVECVLLNSCYSKSQAKAIGKHIKYVIGMKKAIGDNAAIKFSSGFYEALGAGLSFEEAFAAGCNAIKMYNIPGNLTPVLHICEKASKELQKENKPIASLPNDAPVNIYFSYADKDAKLAKNIEISLTGLRRSKLIQSWSKRQILPGAEQSDEYLENAQVILLLISDNFIASDDCYEREMPKAMARHENGEVRVIPIILSKCLWQELPFAKLRELPDNGEAITSWNNRNEAFHNVASGIESVVKQLRNR